MVKVIKGQGMPTYRHHDFGDLYVQFDVKFPDKTELQNIHLLESVLPPRMQQKLPPPDSMVEDFEMNEVDARQHARAHGAHLDEDDDDVPQGAERVQCASQ